MNDPPIRRVRRHDPSNSREPPAPMRSQGGRPLRDQLFPRPSPTLDALVARHPELRGKDLDTIVAACEAIIRGEYPTEVETPRPRSTTPEVESA